MINDIILFLQKISADLIFDIGLLIIPGTVLLAIIYFDFILLLGFASRVKILNKKVGNIKDNDSDRFKKIEKSVKSCRLKGLLKVWQDQIGHDLYNPDKPAWNLADNRDLALESFYITCQRNIAKLVPGIIVIIALLISSIGMIAAGSSDISVMNLWASNWRQIAFLLIAAILSSLLFWIIDGIFALSTVNRLVALFTLFSEKIGAVSENDRRQKEYIELTRQTELLSDMDARISNTVLEVFDNKLIPDLKHSYRMSLEEHLKPEIINLSRAAENFTAHVLELQNEGMQALADSFYEKLSGSYSSQLEKLSLISRELEQVQAASINRMNSLLSTVDENMRIQNDLNARATETINDLTEVRTDLATAADNLASGMAKAGELAESMNQLLEADRRLIAEFAYERQTMQELNNGYFDKMNNQMMQLQDDLNSEIENIFSRFTDVYTTTFEHVDEKTSNLLENFDGQTRTLMESIDEQVRDLTFLSREVSTEVSELNRQLNSSVSGFSESVSVSLEQRYADMEDAVNSLSKKLVSAAEIIRDSVDDLPAAVVLAKTVISEQEKK